MKWGEPTVRWVPKLRVTKRVEAQDPVSVNARLSRLSSNELLDLAEHSLGSAGRDLLHARGTGKQLDQADFYLDRTLTAAKQAYEALQVLVSRGAS